MWVRATSAPSPGPTCGHVSEVLFRPGDRKWEASASRACGCGRAAQGLWCRKLHLTRVSVQEGRTAQLGQPGSRTSSDSGPTSETTGLWRPGRQPPRAATKAAHGGPTRGAPLEITKHLLRGGARGCPHPFLLHHNQSRRAEREPLRNVRKPHRAALWAQGYKRASLCPVVLGTAWRGPP